MISDQQNRISSNNRMMITQIKGCFCRHDQQTVDMICLRYRLQYVFFSAIYHLC